MKGVTPRRLGLLQIGLEGNNATTLTSAILAHRHAISWRSRAGLHTPNYCGSLSQAATLRVGVEAEGRDVCVPIGAVLPLADTDAIELGGWDISSVNMVDACERAAVLEPELRDKLRPYMEGMKPLPAGFDARFIAKNQRASVDNVIPTMDKQEQLDVLRQNIAYFRRESGVEFVAVILTANSERYAAEMEGVIDTADNLLEAIRQSHKEVSPSTLYCVAAILEGCAYVNGSPQNTLVARALELAQRHGCMVCRDDFGIGGVRVGFGDVGQVPHRAVTEYGAGEDEV